VGGDESKRRAMGGEERAEWRGEGWAEWALIQPREAEPLSPEGI